MTRHFRIFGSAIVAGAVLATGPVHAQPGTPGTPDAPGAPVATTVVAERAPGQPTVTMAPVPFAVGEELVYRASFGGVRAGTARMRVEGIDLVRGRPAYHIVFTLEGGIPLFRVKDRYESWIDVETLASLRHVQHISEGRYKRNTHYEIFPERAQYSKNGGEREPSVRDPLDDGSFIYAVRAAGIAVGETRRSDRYFRPDRNPVVLTGLREETVTVKPGTFDAIVVKPTIKTSGIFSEDGEAQVWFSDDAHRYPLQIRSKFAGFSLNLTLESLKAGDASQHASLVASATPAH